MRLERHTDQATLVQMESDIRSTKTSLKTTLMALLERNQKLSSLLQLSEDLNLFSGDLEQRATQITRQRKFRMVRWLSGLVVCSLFITGIGIYLYT